MKASVGRGPLRAMLSAAILWSLYASATMAQDGAAAAPDESGDASEQSPDKAADETKELHEVVVSYTASLERAIELKRDNTAQVDAIVAEDIGKFPDLNLAESMQRVPGVTITRDAGEGRQISVRGLDGQFTRIRINGMEALTSTGGTDSSGGANRARNFDFNVFASDLFNSILVRKTASAEVEEGSLGATVDLNTARPFDYPGFTFATSAQMGYNDLSDDSDPRAAAMISNTFADGALGALLSVAYTDRALIEEGHSTVRWDRGNSSGGFNASSPFAAARDASTFHPRIPRYGMLGHDQSRLGVTSALQWAPGDATLFTFDALYANFDATRSEDFLEAISFSRTGAGKPQTIVRDGVVDANGNLVYGVFDNVDVRSESRYDELETTFQQFSLDGTHAFSDGLRGHMLLGYSKSDFDNPIQTTVTMDRIDVDGYVWDYRGNDRLPLIDYGFDTTDPGAWTFANGVSEIRLRPQRVINTYGNALFELEYDLADAWKLKGGVQWKEYEFASSELRRASETAVPGLPSGVTLADLTRLLQLSDLDVANGTDSVWLAPDFDAFAELLGIYSGEGTFALSSTVAAALGNNREVREKDIGAFAQLDWYGDFLGRELRGNFGVRVVDTAQGSLGFAIVNNVPKLTKIERDYRDTLPSMNLAWDVSDDVVLRFAAAKVMSRPGLGNLTPGVTVSVSGGNRTVTGGDPYLEPFRAKTADLAVEWYFDEQAVLSLGAFYKDIDTFVQTSRETRPFSSSGLPDSLLDGTGATPDDDFQFNIPLNTPGGELTGVEFLYQQPFTFLPDPFDGFGVQFNYTYVDSKIQYLTAAGAAALSTDLTGLSKNACNLTGYFEGERFGARVSGSYRDGYLTTVPGRNNNNVEGTAEVFTVDASASYKISDAFELTFEALNLTDEFNDQWVDSIADRSSVYHHTGRQYLVGFRFKN